MRLFKKSTKNSGELAVGPELLAVLPQSPKPWYRTGHLLRLNLLLLIPLFSSATVGFDGAMMNGLQSLPQWNGFFDYPSAGILGTINAVYPLGNICGLLPATWLGDRYGRKRPMYFGFIFLLIGSALQGAAQSLSMFMIARLLLGTATAFLSQPSPILVTELAYPTHRGKITALYNTFYYFGAILAAWSTYGTFRLQSNWAWRIPSLMQGALPLIQASFFFWHPESPRWLVAHRRNDEARRILTTYHAGGDESSPLINFEMTEIEESVRFEGLINSQTSYLDLFRTVANRRRTFIAVTLGLGSQWNGVGVVSYYLTLVLNTIGITDVSSQTLINGMLQIFNWIAAVLGGALMVDHIGRRRLLLISTAGMLISYICWTALNGVFARDRNQAVGNAVLGFIFIFYFFYDIGWTPLVQAYTVEIYPFSLRGRGLTTTLASTIIGLIFGQFINPIAMEAIGWKYYIVFCCILAILLLTVYFFYPETKGRTLEEISQIFEGRPETLMAHQNHDLKGEEDERTPLTRGLTLA